MNIKIQTSRHGLVAIIFLFIFVCADSKVMRAHRISDDAKFSLLTCTPGPDLYSLFGHSAIRYQDSSGTKWVDIVFNYGTFEFDDDFYVKFARGKLDYMLSVQDFPNFQHEYIMTGRGIYEQTLNLSQEQKQILYDLLEENYQPQNKTYRYDFFYDNCSTRIRDMIIRATSGVAPDNLGFRAPDSSAISAMNRISFSYVYPREFTYRQAIQKYLNFQPWSDFGIDLALGMPCDKKVIKGGYMFLPDSLMNEFHYAIIDDSPLVLVEEELLPQDYVPSVDTFFTPMMVMMIVLILHLISSFISLRWSLLIQMSDRIILFSTGLLGLFVVFLWFFTDHNATKWNLNLLWANPFNLYLAFLSINSLSNKMRKWISIYFVILTLTLIGWFALPQRFNLAVIPLVLSLIFTSLKILRPKVFLGSSRVIL